MANHRLEEGPLKGLGHHSDSDLDHLTAIDHLLHIEVQYHLIDHHTEPHLDLLENIIEKGHLHIHLQDGQHRLINSQGMVGADHPHHIIELKSGDHHLHIIESIHHHHITPQEVEVHLQNGFLDDGHHRLTTHQETTNPMVEIRHTDLQKEVMIKGMHHTNLQIVKARFKEIEVDQEVLTKKLCTVTTMYLMFWLRTNQKLRSLSKNTKLFLRNPLKRKIMSKILNKTMWMG